jgi:hypothetical protein
LAARASGRGGEEGGGGTASSTVIKIDFASFYEIERRGIEIDRVTRMDLIDTKTSILARKY